MKQNRLHRGMALLLAVCMMLTMNGGFAFAAEEPLPTEASTTETSGDAPTADSGKEYLADPMGSATEGETPSVDAPVCTCNPAPGTSSVEGHGEDCPLYEEPEPPADEQGECVCPTVDSGEVVHGEDCPLYVAPEKPAAPEAPNDALAAVYALIDALPTMAELEAVDPAGADFPAYLEKLQADAEAARAAYGALTPEERETFDPARLEKLAGIEGLFGVSMMALAVGDTFTAKVKLDGAEIDCSFIVLEGNTAQVGSKVINTSASAISTSSAGALVIPSSVSDGTNPYTVTGIGANAFHLCKELTSVTIPDGVKSIGKWAFRECDSLREIKLPSALTSIETEGFLSCSGLTSITIPGGVTSISDNAFQDCYGLTSVTISKGVKSISDRAFSGCNALTRIEIPSSVTSIGVSAFNMCSKLPSITIPDSVTSIGDEAFARCKALTSIKIPEGVTVIGKFTFMYSSALTSVTLPNGVTSIGKDAFYRCSALTSVTIPSSVTSIGESAFKDCTSLTSIDIPAGINKIENSTFYNCTALESVTIPNNPEFRSLI